MNHHDSTLALSRDRAVHPGPDGALLGTGGVLRAGAAPASVPGESREQHRP
jgi:hypothetical protein